MDIQIFEPKEGKLFRRPSVGFDGNANYPANIFKIPMHSTPLIFLRNEKAFIFEDELVQNTRNKEACKENFEYSCSAKINFFCHIFHL